MGEVYKSIPETTGIVGAELVSVCCNRDSRGCLYEIFRDTWPSAFKTVQWNACASQAKVVRGVHVHVDYHEFYTLPLGQVVIGLHDIRRDSPSFGRSCQFHWSHTDGVAIVVPRGVAHVVHFLADSVLAFGLSDYWCEQFDVVGCQWDDPALGFDWSNADAQRSERDSCSGSYRKMLDDFEQCERRWRQAQNKPSHADLNTELV